MNIIEKIRPIGINTDISPEAVEQGNQGNRAVINPVIDCLNKHYITSEVNESLKAQNIKGNLLKTNGALPVGTNICIGTYEDKLNNELVFWNYNSNGNHGVYAYSPETDLIRTLIAQSALAFQNDRRYLITGVGSIGNLIYWSDGFNPQRVINRTRSYTYGTFLIGDITVLKASPTMRATVGDAPNSQNAEYARLVGVPANNTPITDKNYQFSYRYLYLDNEYSVIAPISELNLAQWNPDPFNSTRNFIRVRLNGLPTAPEAFIKAVEFLVRLNNSADWGVWHTVRPPVINTEKFFTGTETVIPIDQVASGKLFEAIPRISKALTTHRNRLFLSADEEGFDVNDTPTIAVTETPFSYQSTRTLAGSGTMIMGTGPRTVVLSSTMPLVVNEHIEIKFSGAGHIMRGYVTSQVGTTVNFISQYVTTNNNQIWGPLTSAVFRQSRIVVDASGSILHRGEWSKSYWKTNSMQIFGIALFDENGISMGVVSKTKYTAPTGKVGPTVLNGDVACANDVTVDISISGNFSATPKAKKYSICVTEDQFYLTYQQILVKVLFYVGEYVAGGSLHAGQYIMNNKVFTRSPATGFNSMYLLLPLNMALSVEDSLYVRPLSIPGLSGWTGEINKVESVISGNLLQVDRLGLTDAQIATLASNHTVTYTDSSSGATASANMGRMIVEIFKPREVTTNNVFYEITDRHAIDNSGLLAVTLFQRIQGPNYRPQSNLNLDPAFRFEDQIDMVYNEPLNVINFSGTKIDVTFPKNKSYLINPEIPSPTIGLASNLKTPSVYGVLGSTTPVITRQKIVTPDYTKVGDNRGKTITELIEKKTLARPSVIRFSNKFVQDTNINGLSNFDFADQYSLDYSRGALTKFVSIGTRILAVHDRATSVVYTEEKMVRNADGSDQLIAASEAIGYDQQLAGGYGAYHAESVQAVDNMVFGFDIYKGCVWRYTQEGQFPISDYGYKGKFRDIAQSILATKQTSKVIGGIDPFNKEYVITIAGITYAFNYVKNVWTTRYSFTPEMYGTIGQKFISFKDGQLWLHNVNSVHNNFYGVQYGSFIKMAVNPHPTKVKVGMGIQLAQEKISTDIDYKQVEITTESGQYSYLKSDEFEKLEGVFYASILRDVNTPPATIPSMLALRQGDDMRGKVITVQLNDDSNEKNTMQMVNLNYVLSEYSE